MSDFFSFVYAYVIASALEVFSFCSSDCPTFVLFPKVARFCLALLKMPAQKS